MNRRTLIAALAATPLLAKTTAAMNTETDATLTIHGVRIPGRVSHPTAAVRGAVLILPGSLFSDIDGDFPAWNIRPHVYRDLATQLAVRGVAVMRQAKIGPGTGSETIDVEAAKAHRHFETRTEVASAALDHLRRAFPSAKCYVAGHSEGAIVASRLAPRRTTAIAGVVSLSGPALRLLDIMRGQVAAMSPGADLSLFDASCAAVRAGRPLPEAARTSPQTQMLASMPPESLNYLREVDAVDPTAAAAQVPQPMLIVQGGRDQSVTPEQADQLIAARKNLPTNVARFPELQHFYKRAAPGLDAMQSFALADESDPAVANAIATWIG